MAPLPPSNTARYKIHYTINSFSHTMQLRSSGSPAAVGTFVDTFFTDLVPLLFNRVIDSVEFAASGSDIFNPVVSGIEGNSYGAGSPLPDQVPWALNFIGRTSGGRRVRIAVFGPVSLGTNYRWVAGEAPSVDAAIATLSGAGSLIEGIDGLTPIWKTYANVKPFDHWIGEVR